MKKALAIGGAVLGALLAAALVIFVFFPGLPTYFKVRHRFEHTDEKVPVFATEDIPGDFESHTLRGLRFSAPPDWKGYSSIEGMEPNSYHSDGGDTIFITHGDYSEDEENYLKAQETLGSGYDMWSGYEYDESDYRHMFASLGTELPQSYLSLRMLWYIRDGFTAKDCIKLRGRDKKVFLELAQVKDESIREEDIWKIDGDGFTAYAGQITGFGYEGKLWTVNVFPDGDENAYFMASIKCSDEETAKQMISSIELG